MWLGWSSRFIVLRKLLSRFDSGDEQKNTSEGFWRDTIITIKGRTPGRQTLASWMIIPGSLLTQLRNRILRLFDPPHQMMSSLQLREQAQLGEFGALIAEATGLMNVFSTGFWRDEICCPSFFSVSLTSCRKVKLWISFKFQGWKSNYLDSRWSFRVCDLAPKSLVPFELYIAHCSI